MKDLIERQAAIDAVKKNTFRLTFAEEQNCEGHVAWSANAVYSDVMEGALLELPSAQPNLQPTCNLASNDCISRQAAIDICNSAIDLWHGQLGEGALVAVQDKISGLPSAQLNLSEAYSKAVFTWLMDYQIRAAELKGRYTPYEVLSWVANDWRKEHEGSD